ncbi:MAG: YfcE family phosphodiesterase [Blastocatellia bacterium]|nr:MAG: YfcE family phosphodiesterase [Blastocatellia bacterium]
MQGCRSRSRGVKNRRDRFIAGLISDTHGLWRAEVEQVFSGVEIIVHAGDVGGAAVLRALSKIAPVEAVYGNVDDPNDPALARERAVPVAGLLLHVSHGHELGRPTPQRVAHRYSGDILVFGHTHHPLVTKIAGADGKVRLIVNPGAAGPRRFDVQPTVALLTVTGGVAVAEIISLA